MKTSQDHSLCQQHQDQPSSLRASCEGKRIGKRPKAEGQSKSASAAGGKKTRSLLSALLCLCLSLSFCGLGMGAPSFDPQATARLLEVVGEASLEEVQSLLAAGADVHAKEDKFGTTALMWAAGKENPGVIKTLLAAGLGLKYTPKPKPA